MMGAYTTASRLIWLGKTDVGPEVNVVFREERLQMFISHRELLFKLIRERLGKEMACVAHIKTPEGRWRAFSEVLVKDTYSGGWVWPRESYPLPSRNWAELEDLNISIHGNKGALFINSRFTGGGTEDPKDWWTQQTFNELHLKQGAAL